VSDALIDGDAEREPPTSNAFGVRLQPALSWPLQESPSIMETLEVRLA
jgi:hypothetical protein